MTLPNATKPPIWPISAISSPDDSPCVRRRCQPIRSLRGLEIANTLMLHSTPECHAANYAHANSLARHA